MFGVSGIRYAFNPYNLARYSSTCSISLIDNSLLYIIISAN